MHSRTFIFTSLFLGISRVAVAQTDSLQSVLESNPDLSEFKALVTQDKELMDLLNGVQKKTIFIPDNEAIKEANVMALDPPQRQAFVQYHVLNGTFQSQDFGVMGGKTVPTYLQSQNFALLGGDANVVFASKFGDDGLGDATNATVVFSGVGGESKITTQDIKYDQGVIHKVDKALVFPKTCTETAKTARLNSLFAALERTNLSTFLDTTDRITCFAPSDTAFAAANSPEQNLSPELLAKALQHHTLQGNFVGYSDLFANGGEYTTLSGTKLVVEKKGGDLHINGVKVIKANVITKNGVAHVLDGILPMMSNTTAPPSPTVTPKIGAAGRLAGFSQIMVTMVIGTATWVFL